MSISFFDLYSTLEWDKLLEKFLSQSINLENGSLNIWNDSNKPRGLGYEDFGKTGINTSRGIIETWDGSTWIPLLGNLVTEKNIRNIIQDELKNFNSDKNSDKNIDLSYYKQIKSKEEIDINSHNLNYDQLKKLIKDEIEQILPSLIYKEVSKILPILVETYLFNKNYNSLLDSSELNILNTNDNILTNNQKETYINLKNIIKTDEYNLIDLELYVSKEDKFSSSSFGIYLTDNNLDWKSNINWITNNKKDLKESLNKKVYTLSKLSKTSNTLFNESILLNNIYLPKEYNIIALVKNPFFVIRKTEKLRSFILKYIDLNLINDLYPLSLNKSIN